METYDDGDDPYPPRVPPEESEPFDSRHARNLCSTDHSGQ